MTNASAGPIGPSSGDADPSAHILEQVDDCVRVPEACTPPTVPVKFAWKLPVSVLPLTVYVPDVNVAVTPPLVHD